MDATTYAAIDQLTSAIESQKPQRTSVLEQTFGAFYDTTVTAARNDRRAKFNASPLMSDLNHIKTTLEGIGVVMRMVTANCVKHDNYEPENPKSDPPLSPYAEGALTAMAACVCELLVERIDDRADSYNNRVKS